MNYPIPHLDSLLLIGAILFPGGLGSNLSVFLGIKRERSVGAGLTGMVVAYLVILVLAAMIRPEHVLVFNPPANPALYLLAPVGGIVCMLLEYLAGMLLIFGRTGRRATRMIIHASYSGAARGGLIDLVLILAFIAGEELLLRQTLYGLLLADLALPLWLVVVLCALVYAINHLPFGLQSVMPKFVSGLVYILLYRFSGLSIVVPMIGHATQNLSLLALARRERNKHCSRAHSV